MSQEERDKELRSLNRKTTRKEKKRLMYIQEMMLDIRELKKDQWSEEKYQAKE